MRSALLLRCAQLFLGSFKWTIYWHFGDFEAPIWKKRILSSRKVTIDWPELPQKTFNRHLKITDPVYRSAKNLNSRFWHEASLRAFTKRKFSESIHWNYEDPSNCWKLNSKKNHIEESSSKFNLERSEADRSAAPFCSDKIELDFQTCYQTWFFRKRKNNREKYLSNVYAASCKLRN